LPKSERLACALYFIHATYLSHLSCFSTFLERSIAKLVPGGAGNTVIYRSCRDASVGTACICAGHSAYIRRGAPDLPQRLGFFSFALARLSRRDRERERE
jgi:hypothetical protein